MDSVENPGTLRRGWYLGLFGALSVYAIAFLLYAESWAFAWDETYHLLAAQLILNGKKPYIDFCFPQSPLNAYWNAWWMKILGQSWRVAHAFAALLTIGAVLLTADYVARRFPVPGWRIAGALTAAMAAGLNVVVFQYASLSQAYGMCLFTLTMAFRAAVLAVGQSGLLLTAVAGFFAGTAAGSSLLTAAAAPILLAWILVYNRAGSRWLKFFAFGIGAAVPFAPVAWLFSQGPRATWFNLVQYHASYRKLYWPDTTSHDTEVLTSWIDSGPALVLGLLALLGLLYVARTSQWPGKSKPEFYLCAWLAAGLSAEVGLAHPTFAQYFLLIVPFLAILSVAGLYAISSRALAPDRRWPVLLVTGLYALGLARALYTGRDDATWSMYEHLAAKVEQVTPRNALLFANEPVYFLTRRAPPPGYELHYTHKLNLPPAEAATLHVLSDAEVNRQLHSGMFATAYACADDAQDYGLKDLYKQHADLEGCTVFWEPKPAQPRTN